MTDAKVQNTLKQLNHLKMSGVNENIGNTPKNRYGTKKSSKSKTSDSSISVNNSSIEDQKTINSLESLDSLKDFMANYDKCKLHESATNMVFSDGNPKSEIMLIGEAPGHDEDIQGKPFVGRSGKLLDKMLEAINLNREKVYIANIVPWRPPNNRRPTDEEIDMCLPMIKKHIELSLIHI